MTIDELGLNGELLLIMYEIYVSKAINYKHNIWGWINHFVGHSICGGSIFNLVRHIGYGGSALLIRIKIIEGLAITLNRNKGVIFIIRELN